MKIKFKNNKSPIKDLRNYSYKNIFGERDGILSFKVGLDAWRHCLIITERNIKPDIIDFIYNSFLERIK